MSRRNVAGRLGRGVAAGLADEFLGLGPQAPLLSPAAPAGTASSGQVAETNWLLYGGIALCVCCFCCLIAFLIYYFAIREGFEGESENQYGGAGCGAATGDEPTFYYS